jgi:hypothetical protein
MALSKNGQTGFFSRYDHGTFFSKNKIKRCLQIFRERENNEPVFNVKSKKSLQHVIISSSNLPTLLHVINNFLNYFHRHSATKKTNVIDDLADDSFANLVNQLFWSSSCLSPHNRMSSSR